MKRLLNFLRITIVGGVLFLAPIILIIIILGKAHKLALKLVRPLAEHLPFEPPFGFEAPWFLAAFLLLVFCLLAGLLAKTVWARKMIHWLEASLLSALPGYSFMKTVGEEYAGESPSDKMQSILVRLDDSYLIGFKVEELSSGHTAVFIPGAPRPWNGDIMIVENDRIIFLSTSSKVAVNCLSQMGQGIGNLVKGKLERPLETGGSK